MARHRVYYTPRGNGSVPASTQYHGLQTSSVSDISIVERKQPRLYEISSLGELHDPDTPHPGRPRHRRPGPWLLDDPTQLGEVGRALRGLRLPRVNPDLPRL